MKATLKPLTPVQRAIVTAAMDEFVELAATLAKRLRANVDDLRSAMHLQLVQSVTVYEPSRNVPFNGYAYRGVLGAMLDAVSVDRRELAWKVVGEMYRTEDGMMHDDESADTLDLESDVTPHEVASSSLRARAAIFVVRVAWQQTSTGGEDDAIDKLERDRIFRALEMTLPTLTEREQRVLRLIHAEGMKLQDIAEQLGVDKRTVQRTHDAACEKLGTALRRVGIAAAPSKSKSR